MTPQTNPAVSSASPSFAVNPETDLQAMYVTSIFNTGAYQINPWYCSTLPATERFVTYVKEKLNLVATISFDWPEGAFAAGSPFQQNGMVPYIDFTETASGNVAHMNGGGTLLEYYQFPNAAADETLKKWLSVS